MVANAKTSRCKSVGREKPLTNSRRIWSKCYWQIPPTIWGIHQYVDLQSPSSRLSQKHQSLRLHFTFCQVRFIICTWNSEGRFSESLRNEVHVFSIFTEVQAMVSRSCSHTAPYCWLERKLFSLLMVTCSLIAEWLGYGAGNLYSQWCGRSYEWQMVSTSWEGD